MVHPNIQFLNSSGQKNDIKVAWSIYKCQKKVLIVTFYGVSRTLSAK